MQSPRVAGRRRFRLSEFLTVQQLAHTRSCSVRICARWATRQQLLFAGFWCLIRSGSWYQTRKGSISPTPVPLAGPLTCLLIIQKRAASHFVSRDGQQLGWAAALLCVRV